MPQFVLIKERLAFFTDNGNHNGQKEQNRKSSRNGIKQIDSRQNRHT